MNIRMDPSLETPSRLSPDRLGLTLLTPQAPRPRTPAQQEASRRNGRLSRGPLTPAGKARSRRNALKHGLLARVIVPPSDIRDEDRLYRQIHRELRHEFQPVTFTENALVDDLASDYLQLMRFRRCQEALVQPSPLDAEKVRDLRGLREGERHLRLITRACQDLAGKQPFGFTAAQAGVLAEALMAHVKSVEDWGKEDEDLLDLSLQGEAPAAPGLTAFTGREAPSNPVGDPSSRESGASGGVGTAGMPGIPGLPGLPGCPGIPGGRDRVEATQEAERAEPVYVPDDFDREEQENIDRQQALIKPLRRRLGDRAGLLALFQGQRPLTRAMGKCLPVLLEEMRKWEVSRKSFRANAVRALRPAAESRVRALAADPKPLMRLQTYGQQLTRAIARKVAQLQRR